MNSPFRVLLRSIAASAVALPLAFVPLHAQDAAPAPDHSIDHPLDHAPASTILDNGSASAIPDAPGFQSDPAQTTPASPQAPAPTGMEGKQTKRILFIVPNFRSVSVDAKLKPMTVKEKFIGASEDSFDYSSFIFAGMLAGVAQAQNSYPQFHQGAAGYARYFWHNFADQTDENYWVEFIVPVALRQDPRYYTLGRGGFFKRTVYAFSRIAITRQDDGHETFNYSEVVGAGAASAISSLYYPTADRTWTKVGQRWATSIGLDGATIIFKEFWPDLNSRFFHEKD
jgi:hypothetical protein